MSDRAPAPADNPDAVTQNIEAILRMESAALRRRTWADRMSDAIAGFAGTIPFVVLHLLVFAGWALINLSAMPILPAFDPYPFQLLCMLVSLEGVLLSTFVLIKQNRIGYLSDRRAHLDLQINLLAEREVTHVLKLAEKIAERLQVHGEQAPEEMAQETQVEGLMNTLDERLNRSP